MRSPADPPRDAPVRPRRQDTSGIRPRSCRCGRGRASRAGSRQARTHPPEVRGRTSLPPFPPQSVWRFGGLHPSPARPRGEATRVGVTGPTAFGERLADSAEVGTSKHPSRAPTRTRCARRDRSSGHRSLGSNTRSTRVWTSISVGDPRGHGLSKHRSGDQPEREIRSRSGLPGPGSLRVRRRRRHCPRAGPTIAGTAADQRDAEAEALYLGEQSRP